MIERWSSSRLLDLGCVLGEGPTQHTNGDLLWVDIDEGRLHRWDRASPPTIVEFHAPVSAVAETVAGSLIVASPLGLVHVTAEGVGPLVAALPRAGGVLRMNDGKADPIGRFVGGTMTTTKPHPPVGSLWSFGAGPPAELVTDVTISNGLAWTADATTMYFIDTPTQRIDAFDYDLATGAVANRRPVVVVDERDGSPDGMCIDDEGGLWVALWGGGAVHRYVEGELTAVVDVPTPYVTCATFAGENHDQLVITTATEPFGADPPAGAGDLYIVEPGVTGPPPNRVDLALFGAASPR